MAVGVAVSGQIFGLSASTLSFCCWECGYVCKSEWRYCPMCGKLLKSVKATSTFG